MFLSTSNLNLNAATLDVTINKVNLTYISKFGLLVSVTQHINLYLIFHNIHINNLTIALNVELNS